MGVEAGGYRRGREGKEGKARGGKGGEKRTDMEGKGAKYKPVIYRPDPLGELTARPQTYSVPGGLGGGPERGWWEKRREMGVQVRGQRRTERWEVMGRQKEVREEKR